MINDCRVVLRNIYTASKLRINFMPLANWWKLKAGKLVFWFEWNCAKGNKDTDILKWLRDDSEIRFKKKKTT